MQKDTILATLGVMSRAASNVAAESSIAKSANTINSKKKKFGHLHIVFRDWQAATTDPNAVYHDLFGVESSTDAVTRNQIRKDIINNFESIQIWLVS